MSSPSLYFAAFLFGGILCLVGQILIDKTKLTPRPYSCFICSYWCDIGRSRRLPTLNRSLRRRSYGSADWLRSQPSQRSKGIHQKRRLLGVLTGGITAAAGRITAAVFFGYLAAVFFRPKPKD